MRACEHANFRADVDVIRITDNTSGDVSQFMAEVRVECADCGAKFGFRGPPAAVSWREPRCTVDALEIQLPLMSPAELELAGPLPALERGPMVYETTP